MEWISVKDKLPERGEWVLVFDQENTRSGYKDTHVGYRDGKGNVFEVGHNPWDYYGTHTTSITHWMPLPKEPE